MNAVRFANFTTTLAPQAESGCRAALVDQLRHLRSTHGISVDPRPRSPKSHLPTGVSRVARQGPPHSRRGAARVFVKLEGMRIQKRRRHAARSSSMRALQMRTCGRDARRAKAPLSDSLSLSESEFPTLSIANVLTRTPAATAGVTRVFLNEASPEAAAALLCPLSDPPWTHIRG